MPWSSRSVSSGAVFTHGGLPSLDEQALSKPLEVVGRWLQAATALGLGLLWLIAVALLIRELLSWWVELEGYGVSGGIMLAREFGRSLE